MDADVADAPAGTPVGSSSMTSDDSTPVTSDSSEAEDGDRVGTDSDDETPLEEFAPDEQELADTTRRQHYEEGRDLQGIPWERLQVWQLYKQQVAPDPCPMLVAIHHTPSMHFSIQTARDKSEVVRLHGRLGLALACLEWAGICMH